MPLPIALAHRLALQLTGVRKDGTLDYTPGRQDPGDRRLRRKRHPVALDTVVISTQHNRA